MKTYDQQENIYIYFFYISGFNILVFNIYIFNISKILKTIIGHF